MGFAPFSALINAASPWGAGRFGITSNGGLALPIRRPEVHWVQSYGNELAMTAVQIG